MGQGDAVRAERTETREERAERVYRELTGRPPKPVQLVLEHGAKASRKVVSMSEWLARRGRR